MYNSPLNKPIGFLPGLILLLLIFSNCRSSEDDLVRPSEFTKEQRESLGDIIQSAIKLDSRDFAILPNIAPYDEAYQVATKLYDQVTNAMRLDRQSPSNNRWNTQRDWEIGILISEEQNAFILPGGHLYITTGFLKALQSEHELYYLLAYEANLMNEKFLLNRLFSTYNTSTLLDIVNGPLGQSDVSPKEIALTLAHMNYEEEDLKAADNMTIDLICQTSVFNNDGLSGIYASSLDGQIQWVANRDYPGRLSLVSQLIAQRQACGQFTTEGAYEEKVLANLP